MPMSRLIKLGLLLFWAAYFTLVLASNAADALRALGALPQGFAFVSGNYALMEQVTRIYAVPAFGVAILFAGVLLWQLVVSALFWRAFAAFSRSDLPARHANAAFAAALGLWAAFILADEALIAYEVAGLEATHVRLLATQLISLLVFHSKLDRSAPPAPAARGS
jgi:hypothetical protein